MKARVYVTLKPTVLDPQGEAIRKALNAHGHASITHVRQGKFFEVKLADGTTAEAARAEMETIGREILANPVIEDFRVEIPD